MNKDVAADIRRSLRAIALAASTIGEHAERVEFMLERLEGPGIPQEAPETAPGQEIEPEEASAVEREDIALIEATPSSPRMSPMEIAETFNQLIEASNRHNGRIQDLDCAYSSLVEMIRKLDVKLAQLRIDLSESRFLG